MSTKLAAPATMGGCVSTSLVVVGVVVALVYFVYRLALPKPIPGIPYNEKSSKRLLGDLHEFMALQNAGFTPRRFWTDLAVAKQSPITQYFLGPFSKPAVVISDFREAQDLMVRRGKDLGRGTMNRDAWAGVVPEHFIGMENHDKRIKETKGLLNDLMTPKFLHETNCPASYQKVLEFIELWQEKTKIAEGRPFDALQDLSSLTYDIILAAALGLDDTESETARQLHRLQRDDMSSLRPAGQDEVFPFPVPEPSDLLHALHVIAKSAGASFTQPSQRLFHFFNNRTAPMKKAFHSKKTVLQSYIDRSDQRIAEEGESFKPRSAVDYMVSREIAMAKKAGRAPALESLRLNDVIFGYLIGGQDSTHSTLSFLVKHLETKQDCQKKLRDLLRQAYPEALARREQPDLQDILKTPVPYLDALIEEVLRMSDPTMAVSKETLCDMEILGHFVPKGTMIVFCLTGPTFQQKGMPVAESLRSETSQKRRTDGLGDWGESKYPSNEFWPERWLRPSDDEKGGEVFDSQAGPFLAFSSGTRACWGKRLAYLELKLVVTLFLWNFVFEKLPEEMVDWDIDDDLFVKPRRCRVKLSSAWGTAADH